MLSSFGNVHSQIGAQLTILFFTLVMIALSLLTGSSSVVLCVFEHWSFSKFCYLPRTKVLTILNPEIGY